MLDTLWKNTELDTDSADMSWEQFHESSKTGRYDVALTSEQVLAEMENLYESLPYNNFPPIPLPNTLSPIDRKFSDIVLSRVTPREFKPEHISLEQLRTILHLAYGETRDNKNNPYVRRPFRSAPSGGGLYPLELYFYNGGHVKGLEEGIYHFSPSLNALHFIKPGNYTKQISKAFVEFQSHLAENLSLLIFITAIFQRSVFKYRNKGYRFCLFEAGHVAQNINLTATALGMGVINLGGFYDRKIDNLLELDGLHHSILYMNGLCAGSKNGEQL